MIISTFHWFGGHKPDISSEKMTGTREMWVMIKG